MKSQYWWNRTDNKVISTPKSQKNYKKSKQRSLYKQKVHLQGAAVRQMKKLQIQLENYLKDIEQLITFYEILTEKPIQSTNKKQYMTIARCFKHNNNIIFYCQTDKQLLCANCAYGKKSTANTTENNKHQKHQILKVQKSHRHLQKDIKDLSLILKGQSEQIVSKYRLWNDLSNKLQQTARYLQKQLDKKYDLLLQNLSTSYLKIKKNLQNNSNQLQESMKRIRHCYKLQKQLYQKRFPDLEIFHCYQTMISKMNSQMNVKSRKFSKLASKQDAQLNGNNIIMNFLNVFTIEIKKFGSSVLF